MDVKWQKHGVSICIQRRKTNSSNKFEFEFGNMLVTLALNFNSRFPASETFIIW